jgi:uncharacterized protein YbbK (DUF523 family)
MDNEKVKVVVSACLLGDNCRFNGGNNLNEDVLKYIEDKEVLKVCPEVLGMLPTPRPACELKDGKIVTQDGSDMTYFFDLGTYLAIRKAIAFKATEAILKSRSPSCGKNQIYDGTFSHNLIDGSGSFCLKCRLHGMKIFSEKDITRKLREELIKEFTIQEKILYILNIYLNIENEPDAILKFNRQSILSNIVAHTTPYIESNPNINYWTVVFLSLMDQFKEDQDSGFLVAEKPDYFDHLYNKILKKYTYLEVDEKREVEFQLEKETIKVPKSLAIFFIDDEYVLVDRSRKEPSVTTYIGLTEAEKKYKGIINRLEGKKDENIY